MLIWVTGHCNRAAVSRNRYGVEKTVDTHKMLINAIKCYVCLQEILNLGQGFWNRTRARVTTFTKHKKTRIHLADVQLYRVHAVA